jgi:hypothetical protein
VNKQPKSREETPKEGSDSARRYRTPYATKNAASIGADGVRKFRFHCSGRPRGFGVAEGWLPLWLYLFDLIQRQLNRGLTTEDVDK